MRKKTTILLYLVGSALLIWDVIVATNDMQGDTISEIIRDVAYKIWFIPWGFGGIMGHFFWHKKSGGKSNLFAMVGSTTAVIGANVAAYHLQWTIEWWVVLVIFLAGMIGGHLWWAQRAKGGKLGT